MKESTGIFIYLVQGSIGTATDRIGQCVRLRGGCRDCRNHGRVLVNGKGRRFNAVDDQRIFNNQRLGHAQYPGLKRGEVAAVVVVEPFDSVIDLLKSVKAGPGRDQPEVFQQFCQFRYAIIFTSYP